MRPPACDHCGLDGRDEPGFRTLTFAGHRPLPPGMVGHPEGLHWLCPSHAEAYASYTHLTFPAARRVVALAEDAARPVTGRGRGIDLSWRDGDGTSGVHDHEGELLWWYRPGGPGGRFGEAARSQSVDDYRVNGPAVSCPDHVRADLDHRLAGGPRRQER